MNNLNPEVAQFPE
jgi:urocanate hydratase